jgi:bifunctional DNA-binding transcriptional regulator/antitoxin component of YhaV-PrlF toxin-antitoxin module
MRWSRVRSVDDQGRVSIPWPWLRKIGVVEGDQLAVQFDSEDHSIRIAKLVLEDLP